MGISAIESKTWSRFKSPVRSDSPMMLPALLLLHNVGLMRSRGLHFVQWAIFTDNATVGPRLRRSWTRERPPGPTLPLSPQSPGSESIPLHAPPYAPEPPSSPTVSSSTAPSISTATSTDHWASKVFTGEIGATGLPRSGDTLVLPRPIGPLLTLIGQNAMV